MRDVSKGFSNVSESMGDAGSYVVRSAQRNPLPLALIGLGIGLLVMQSKRRRTVEYDRRRTTDYDYESDQEYTTGRQTYRRGDKNRTMFRASSEKVSGALKGARETASNVAGSAYEGVTGAASSAYEGAASLASSTREQAANLGSQVQHVARRAQTQYERTLEDNPLAVGAVALAVGAVVGLAIPSTEYENEWMGERKESLVQSVEEVARDAFSKAQEVAGEVTKTVRESTQNQG